MKRFKRGLICGKFMPLHRGHMHLIDTAASQCDHLTIMVGTLSTEPIDGHIRYEWVKYTYPQHKVIHSVEDALPDWHIENYWSAWASLFYLDLIPEEEWVDAVFTSEEYGDELAHSITHEVHYIQAYTEGDRKEVVHVQVNKERDIVPISATKIRNNPMEYWDYLAPIARGYFAKRILLIGGESCGKSTMAEYLAKHYNTVWVEEFARPYMRLYGNDFYEKIADDIILGQMKTEEAKVLEANKILFCDTDNLVTREYTEEYGFLPPEYMKVLANRKRYDLYLFLDDDLPWENDGMRNRPKRRGEVKELFIKALTSRRIPFTLIRGVGQERFDNAVKVVDDYLKGVS